MRKGIIAPRLFLIVKTLSLLVFLTIYTGICLGTIGNSNQILSPNSTTLFVGGNGSNNYTSIQQAIDNASWGITIYVYSGIYYENVVVNKSLTITGEDRNTTIIDGGSKSNVIYVSTDWVNITGFTVQTSSVSLDAGIKLEGAKNCRIENNNVSNNKYGVHLDSSNTNTISCNIISNNTDGIILAASPDCIITNNIIRNNNYYGIVFYGSRNNAVMDNTITRNYYGIYLESSSSNQIYHNNFINNIEHATTSSAGVNAWDSAYLSSGNYWDDYMGGDANGDFIGDTPYSIPGGNNQDRYPLMIPYNLTINQLPICALSSSPTSGAAPLTVTFTLSASDPDGTITAWALDIDNDGTPEYSGSGTPPSMQQHIYPTTGTYTAKFMVTDNQNITASDAVVITVIQASSENQPPVAHFTYSCDGYIVIFTDESTDSDGVITSWHWDFGDQNYSIESSPVHEYEDWGEYTVQLTVADDDNETSSFSLKITVSETSQNNQLPIVYFTFSAKDLTANFIDKSSDIDGSLIGWHWDFGDNQSSQQQHPTHTYSVDGHYRVTLTVTDNLGGKNNYTALVKVKKEDNGLPGFDWLLSMAGISSVYLLKKRKLFDIK